MENFLLVDGYNVIFAWDNLNKLSKQSIDAARMKLQETIERVINEGCSGLICIIL